MRSIRVSQHDPLITKRQKDIPLTSEETVHLENPTTIFEPPPLDLRQSTFHRLLALFTGRP